MIDDQTVEKAELYVLDLLPADSLRLFEEKLADSSELRALVKQLRESLDLSLIDKASAMSTGLTFDAIWEKIESNPHALKHHQIDPIQVQKKSGINWSIIWAAAALIMLGLNVFLLSEHSELGSSRVETSLSAAEGSGFSEETHSSKLELLAQIDRLQGNYAAVEEDRSALTEQLAITEEKVEEVVSMNSAWQREYTRLASRLIPFFESGEGLSRYTVIEMVDKITYDQNLPRRGFAELAGDLLMGSERIALADQSEATGPVVSPDSQFLSTGGIESANFDAGSARSGAESEGLSPILTGAWSGSSNTDEGQAPSFDEPLGFTVWRDDQQQGFLEVYNLPEVEEGREAVLWVRAGEFDAYHRVGPVPNMENGTGSIYYSVAETNFTPTEIVITSEDQSTEGESPTGEVLLKGP